MKQLYDSEVIKPLKQVEKLVGQYAWEEALEQLQNIVRELNVSIEE